MKPFNSEQSVGRRLLRALLWLMIWLMGAMMLGYSVFVAYALIMSMV